MKKLFFIANWKSHKVTQEVEEWFREFPRHIGQLKADQEVIVCPPFPLLHPSRKGALTHAPFVKIGAQDISRFTEGAYTGDVSGRLVKDQADYVIIGHSERRKYFHETDEILSQKVLMAQANMLTPIFCVSDKQEKIPKGVTIVAYEPLDAIGSGKPAEPEEVEEIARWIKEKNDVSYILYGGSVAPMNISYYTSLPSINGVLVGGASLDPQEFAQLIQHA